MGGWLCTSAKNAGKSDRTVSGASPPEQDPRLPTRGISLHTSGTSTGITNSVHPNVVIESIPSTTYLPSKTIDKPIQTINEGETRMTQQELNKISLAESQFYARTSNTPKTNRKVEEICSSPAVDDTYHDAIDDLSIHKDRNDDVPPFPLVDVPSIPSPIIQTVRPLSSTVIMNPFERLRPLDMHLDSHPSDEFSLKIFDRPSFHALEIAPEPILDQFDDLNDSSTSTTTSRSIHLPVEKQRGLSEIIRKRNSRCKVEDYKRSFQKSTPLDDNQTPSFDRPLPTSKSDHEILLLAESNEKPLSKTYSVEIPLNLEAKNDERIQMSIERLNVLLSTDDQSAISNEENLSVADKKSLFETFGGTLPRSKSSKIDDFTTSTKTKKYANGQQRSKTEDVLSLQQQNETNEIESEKNSFDDDTSKLTFKEKMILFNKKHSGGLTPTSSLKHNRNRLTQPITAEEVQAAANLTPTSSVQQINKTSAEETVHSNPEENDDRLPVSKRLEQFKTLTSPEKNSVEPKPISTSSRKTPTMKYVAKKTNTDQEQRAKTVDIVRLKATEPIVKSKDTNSNKSKSNQKVVSVLKSDTISVLKPDDHIEGFFAQSTTKNVNSDPSLQLNTDDLNRLAQNTIRLQSQTARVRPPRRQQAGAKNPLRQIQATIPTENEYTEIHTNLSEQELRRLKRAQIAETAGQAQEALAALATNESIAEVNLRKIDRSFGTPFGYEPYKDLMLILIKGRRQCSLHLVNPTYQSINEGDCYLLITPLKVFAWLGRHSNSVEKNKTLDLIDYLKQNRDLGLRNETKFFILDQGKDDTENDIHAEFRDVLQGDIDGDRQVDDVTDDDFYEANRFESNRVYRVDDDILMPLDEFCFRPLSIKILDPHQVFVFDFGSELYVWNGKFADKSKRQMGLQLAQQLWNDSFDFSDCVVNPFDPLDDQNEFISTTETRRPIWCLFGKQNQNVETLLFKGKFVDWPNDFNDRKTSTESNQNENRLAATQRPLSIVDALKPADVDQMLVKDDQPVNLILEQTNLGRGRHWFDPVELRGHHIQTLSVNVWLLSENERYELSRTSFGQFHSDDIYLVRWRYKLVPLNSAPTSIQKPEISRDRVAYWIWQGVNASPNERGISALMSVCLNEEKGPNIHVIQEHEEAAFLQLFDGTFTIHMGKRNQSKTKKSPWSLYVFLGEIDVEAHWWELNLHSSNLRSRTSFLFVRSVDNLMLLWHGCGTTEKQKRLSLKSAMKLRERCPEEFHFRHDCENIDFYEMQEGDEIDLFWEAMNEPNHERKYYSLLDVQIPSNHWSTIRIFHLSSLHGPFVAQELLYPLRSPEHVASFPFTQADLYELHQPALCLVDAQRELYIWQGWNDLLDDELGVQLSNANLLAGGPRDLRFTAERRCAFRTALEYCRAKIDSSSVDLPCSIVYAGLEPLDFTNLFPKWLIHKKARQQNQLEGKMINQKDSIVDVLNQLCRDRYTIEELRARPLPEGVDPSRIESYLSDEDFQKEFRLSKDEFYALPFWKQTNLKKPLGFF